MMRRMGSKGKLNGKVAKDGSTSSKENKAAGGGSPNRTANIANAGASSSDELLIKAAMEKAKAQQQPQQRRLFGRRRANDEGVGDLVAGEQKGGRSVRRVSSSELEDMKNAVGNSTSAPPEYKEVIVNGKKKMVRVKKKTAAEAAAGGDQNRKLVKVKVKQVMKKHLQQQPSAAQVPVRVGIPANHQLRKPTVPQRNNSSDNVSGVWSKAARSLFSFHGDKRSKGSSYDYYTDEEDEEAQDLVFRPEGGAAGASTTGSRADYSRAEGSKAEGSRADVGSKAGSKADSKGNRSKGYKPPTQLDGKAGIDTRSTGGGPSKKKPVGKKGKAPTRAADTPTGAADKAAAAMAGAAATSALKADFFEKYGGGDPPPEADFELDGGPPVLEINTNANMNGTKTKSVYQSESMLRRQFIQDQWLSGGSNYVVWETAAAQNKLVSVAELSVTTPATEDTSDGDADGNGVETLGDYADDDVSDISHEELVPPPMLVLKDDDDDDDGDIFSEPPSAEVKKQRKELELWEALCTDRIQRFGAKSALTAESFVNRGIAQFKANQLDDAADSLLSAVCFLEEVHGSTLDQKSNDDDDESNDDGHPKKKKKKKHNARDVSAPSHMHMAQAFFLLGQVYMQQEQYPMAESALYKALKIRQEHLGKSHPDTVECWEKLGVSYMRRAAQQQQEQQGEDAEETPAFAVLQKQAVDILTQVLKLKRAIYGSSHVLVARTALLVANLCASRTENERAQRLYKQVLNVLQRIDKEETACINPDFPDPRHTQAHERRKLELRDIEREMGDFGLKEEILEL